MYLGYLNHHSSGEVSNFLDEDYETLLNFINMETPKRGLKLN